MAERLRAADIPFLSQESSTTPMHVATLEIFALPHEGFDYDTLVTLIADRIAFVPRYRQRLSTVPGHLANPAWVDDDDFDLTYHVRRSALPKPGSMKQLRELVARLMSRRLDRSRPLWETYLVEGLEGDRFAVLSKSHQALVDGVTTLDLGQLTLDVNPEPRVLPTVEWAPRRAPGPVWRAAEAVRETVRQPSQAVETIRGRITGLSADLRRFTEAADGLAAAVSARPRSDGPLQAKLSEQRRFATLDTSLEDYRRVRALHGGTINDVILAAVAGGVRAWLMTRGERLRQTSRVRVLVPMSVIDDQGERTSLGSQVTPHPLALPIGESSPVMRLHQVSYALQAHKETGRAVSASRLAEIEGFAPTTLHALGARVASTYPRRNFQFVVTNVPGPQFPLYALGARMLASYPVLPLLPGQPLAIGVTSYDGQICYGIDVDRDAIPDVDVLAQCIADAVEELVEATSESRMRAPRGQPPRRDH